VNRFPRQTIFIFGQAFGRSMEVVVSQVGHNPRQERIVVANGGAQQDGGLLILNCIVMRERWRVSAWEQTELGRAASGSMSP